MTTIKRFLFIAFFLFFLVGSAGATVATFQQGTASYTGAKNIWLSVSSPNQSKNDSSGYLVLKTGDDNPFDLFYFDISSIPTTATVNSATLTVYVADQACVAETLQVQAIENPDNSGAFAMQAAAGDVSNQYADYLYKDDTTNIDWSSAESNNFTDVDDAAPESNVAVAACAAYAAKSMSVTTMVTGWVANPNSNGGMALSCTNACSLKIKSLFYATTGERPLLTVDYTEAAGSASREIVIDE